MKKYIGEGALLLNTIIWGATFAIIKNALQDVSPMVFISLRFTFAALILLPFVLRSFKKYSKPLILGGALLGLFYFLGFATQTIGLNYTSATKSGFITGTFVIFTPLFQLLIEKRAPTKANIAGIVLVLSGLIFLSSKETSFFNIFSELGKGFNIGDFFTILCAIFFALYLVYMDIISRKFDYMPLVFIQIAVTGIGGIAAAIILSGTGIETIRFSFSSNLIFAVLYTSILATIITTILQTKFQKVVSPTKAGIIFSLEPIFAALIAFFALSEKISNFGLIGCTLIFTGLFVTEVFDKNNKSNKWKQEQK